MRRLFTKLFDKTFLKFIVVGVINTLVGTTIMFGLYNLAGFGYWQASLTNYILTSILSYILNSCFTFRNTEKGWGPVLRFALNILVCYVVAYGIAKPMVRWIFTGINETIGDNLAMLVGMCLFVLLNYLGQKFFAFRKKS